MLGSLHGVSGARLDGASWPRLPYSVTRSRLTPWWRLQLSRYDAMVGPQDVLMLLGTRSTR